MIYWYAISVYMLFEKKLACVYLKKIKIKICNEQRVSVMPKYENKLK